MSASACDKFVRNAWKKELCSNCFKVKAEHIEKKPEIVVNPVVLADPPKEGILKGMKCSPKNAKKVAFHSNEQEIIGFGGEDEFSDDEDDRVDSGVREVVEEPDTEQDKALQKLTKNNTDYNSVMSNLVGPSTPAPVGLGNHVLDKDGAKKTLFVSVSPFGASQKESQTAAMKPILSRFENGPIPKEVSKSVDVAIKRSQPLDKNFKYRLNKDVLNEHVPLTAGLESAGPGGKLNDKLMTSKVANLLDKAKKKVHNLSAIGDLQNLKPKSIESKLNEFNEGVTLEIYHVQEIEKNISTTECPNAQHQVKIDTIKKDKRGTDEYIPPAKAYEVKPDIDIGSGLTQEESAQESATKINDDDIGPYGKLCSNYEGLLLGEEVTLFRADEEGLKPDVGDEEGEEPLPLCAAVAIAPEEDEPPALPSSPPPTADARISFLHQLTTGSLLRASEKPKLPVKPTVIPAKKVATLLVSTPLPKSPSKEGLVDDGGTPIDVLADPGKKRPAPQPPQEALVSQTTQPSLGVKELAATLSKFSRNGCSTTLHVRSDVSQLINRRSYSLSEDCLLDSGISEVQRKKKNTRGRFSLRKFLHLGKNTKEIEKEDEEKEHGVGNPRQKPEIIHPVELLRLDAKKLQESGNSPYSPECLAAIALPQEAERKPLPPPRFLHSDNGERPARPPPPACASPKALRDPIATAELSRQSCASSGEMMSNVTPKKPARTGSLREIDVSDVAGSAAKSAKVLLRKDNWTGSLRGIGKYSHQLVNQPDDSGYESFDVSLTTASDSNPSSHSSSTNNDDNLYESVMQLEADFKDAGHHPRSDCRSGCNFENDYGKFRFLRSISMPQCAADVDMDIYSPYSFCASEMGEDDYEWSSTSSRYKKVSRLKLQKGRSIVHKNLEDNYGAVVVANHEALTQVVQQLHQGPVPPPALRSMITATNLRWSDFTVVRDHGSVTVGQRTLYPALWGLEPVTLCIAPQENVGSLHGKPPFSLQPLIQLHDLVPACFLSPGSSQDTSLVQCSISVLSRMQVESLHNYCQTVSASTLTGELEKEIYFVLLLIINALKTQHQASGIEEVPAGLTNVLVCREDRDPHPWICLLPEEKVETVSLCGSLLNLLQSLPATELKPLLEETLRAEKAVSLSHAKALLEFTLWGPADISFERKSRGAALQRWLDLERASILQGLVRTRSHLSVFEEWHLLFLAHTNAKVLSDASDLLGS